MPLITGDALVADTFTTVGDDAPLPEAGGAIVSLQRFQKDRETLLARNAPIGVALKAGENPELLGEDVHRLSVVALDFPIHRDGRAFSWARILRTRMGYAGQVRAVGKFIYDQMNYQRRVGFDAWEVPEGFTLEQFHRALSEMTYVYQPSTDGRKTIRNLRDEARAKTAPLKS
jgi:uncharacterized protein (DUF934 family)